MKLINSKLLRITERIVDFFLLNIIWLLFSLPVITIFPSTTAMVGVTRKWYLGKETEGVLKTFFALFKENFRKSLWIGMLWTALSIFFYIDYQIIDPFQSGLMLVLFLVISLAFLLFWSITIYLLPVLVHFETNWKNIWRNALIASLSHPMTIAMMGFILAILYSVYKAPVLILIIGSISSYFIYAMCHVVFLKVQQK